METAQLTCLIDKELKKELQVIAAKKETTITAIITKFIEEYVEENK